MTAPRCRNPHCGKPRKRRADNRGWTGYCGYCSACAERWRLAGRPPEGPPAASEGTERAARISAGLRAHHAACGQSEAALGALAAGRTTAQAKTNREPRPALTDRERSARISAGMSAWHAPRLAAFLQDYACLTSFGESRERAAQRVGISVFTARNYERRLAEMAARGATA